ncbi:MAG: hypothetical protein P8Y45_15355, partial [Exilibacterium sp.]
MGIKADLFDNTLRINDAIFTTDYEDLQFVIREDFAPIVFYAGEAQIDGDAAGLLLGQPVRVHP